MAKTTMDSNRKSSVIVDVPRRTSCWRRIALAVALVLGMSSGQAQANADVIPNMIPGTGLVLPLIGGAVVGGVAYGLTREAREGVQRHAENHVLPALQEVATTGSLEGPAVATLRQLLRERRILAPGIVRAELAKQADGVAEFQDAHQALIQALYGGSQNPTVTERLRRGAMILESRGWLREEAQRMQSVDSFNPPNRQEVEVHHAVHYREPLVAAARTILDAWQLSVHDPANGSVLLATCHRDTIDGHRIPNQGYVNKVNQVMTQAHINATALRAAHGLEVGRQRILEAMRGIGDEMDRNCGDARSRAFHAAHRLAERGLPRPLVNGHMDNSRVVLR